ncbi:MAG: hypothetical protein QF669_09355 [Candidatus Marinimicrobia bacterium]|nr:hypothetical protein [Candidatus Neomarinimicrobiota bacterium]
MKWSEIVTKLTVNSQQQIQNDSTMLPACSQSASRRRGRAVIILLTAATLDLSASPQ